MKEKLEKVRETLEFYTEASNITCANQSLTLMEGKQTKMFKSGYGGKIIKPINQKRFGFRANKAIALIDSILAELDNGEVSDGYHTFNELYEHRHTLFAYLLRSALTGWKSKLHDDGTMFEGWFVAGLNISERPVTYHIPMRLWDLFKCKELPTAPKWDGHTSDDVIKRFKAAIEAITNNN